MNHNKWSLAAICHKFESRSVYSVISAVLFLTLVQLEIRINGPNEIDDLVRFPLFQNVLVELGLEKLAFDKSFGGQGAKFVIASPISRIWI